MLFRSYDTAKNAYADFSGRGFTRVTNQIKPDLAAPGVGIMSASVGGGYGSRSGTSFATPFVTGSAALMMEWGIIQGKDPYLYGAVIIGLSKFFTYNNFLSSIKKNIMDKQRLI